MKLDADFMLIRFSWPFFSYFAALQPLASDTSLKLPQSLADHVAKVVLDKFADLTNNFTETTARRKVLAGFVMSTGSELNDVQVISLATGTKCINGEYISDQGTALNDCHAEIVARRSLLRFLYTQLKMHSQGAEEAKKSILEPKESGGFKLNENVQFHLYISTSPCGDARIFSPHEPGQDGEGGDRHPNRKARGQLRTKIESGEGTIPVRTSSSIQTWDGVLQGERLLTMSCSDKICKWNVVGMQGKALFPLFLVRIFLLIFYYSKGSYNFNQCGTCKTKPRRGAASRVTEFSIFSRCFQLIHVPK
jgi:double stranded RNA-specific editase B